ncbi:MAG: protein kinase domain-containing protein, partial [Collinsella intestinalis]
MPDGQRVLGGRYLLKDKVGNGGMASVYRAQDQVLDRTVAVKIMLPQYAGDATFAARFKQEAQAAAGLQSPYIVGVYDWGKDDDTYYIVMEYLRGTDLKSGVRSHGALDPKKVAQIGSQICGALSVAHKHEIIHRDIKPQNIMVLPDGNIKVMDFGIARAKNSHLTQDNNVLGTAHYVS